MQYSWTVYKAALPHFHQILCGKTTFFRILALSQKSYRLSGCHLVACCNLKTLWHAQLSDKSPTDNQCICIVVFFPSWICIERTVSQGLDPQFLNIASISRRYGIYIKSSNCLLRGVNDTTEHDSTGVNNIEKFCKCKYVGQKLKIYLVNISGMVKEI